MPTGYRYYRTAVSVWECDKCSAIVGDPHKHEEAHQELITALGAWASLLEKAEEN